MPDWTGNSRTIYTIIGATNHAFGERAADDFYATDPVAIDLLMESGIELAHDLWEPACGQGHLSERLKTYNYNVYSTDLIDRGYGDDHFDFLASDRHWSGDIITNPPYKYAQAFVEHALDLIDDGRMVILFLKLSFLESKVRKSFFARKQLEAVYVFSDRITCAKNGDFEAVKTRSAVAYGWFVFRKGYNGWPQIRWL